MQEFAIDRMLLLLYNLGMNNEESIIKKINHVFRLGYLPSRKGQSYRFFTKQGEAISSMANCFEHACFNLLNKHFDKYDFNYNECSAFWNFPASFTDDQKSRNLLQFYEFIKETGLEVLPCDINTPTNYDEWKIGIYFDYFNGDFHFMLQEEDFSWSSKLGDSTKVEVFSQIPKKFNNSYELHSFHKIKNPYIDSIDFEK